tara:strand:+ start:886 stop:1104 length:219 start_codon:yes stop_codon:yes gene_type:complete
VNTESELDQYMVEILVIDNCYIKDESMALILESVLAQKSLKELVYIRNEFGKNSVEIMSKILEHQNSGIFLR